MTRVYQALYAPPPRPELGPCPWVVCPLIVLYTKGCPRPDSTLGHSPLRHHCRSRTDAESVPQPRTSWREVRCGPLLPSVGARAVAQRSLTPGTWLGVLYSPQNRHASTAHCQHHRAKILAVDCMAGNTSPVLYMGRQRLRECQ